MTSSQAKAKGKFGARVFLLGADVACVFQTVKSGGGYTDRYIVDQKPTGKGERFVALMDDKALANAVREALQGKL
jgi:hypothetical protein